MHLTAPIASTIRSLAEDQAADYAPWPGSETFHGPDFDVWFAPPGDPDLTIVRRIRLSPGRIEEAVATARRLILARGRTAATWSITGSATPTDLAEHLESCGMQPDGDPILKAVVLQQAPGAGSPDVDVHRDSSAADHLRMYTADVDGVAVAIRATFTDVGVVLTGDVPLVHARGPDAYRALVAACWNDAVVHGTPLLTTVASPAAHPMLERMGFTDVCDVHMLLDRF